MLTIDILRHGALQGGVKYRGQTDEALTSSGRQAMDDVWQSCLAKVDCIVTSPLSRCVEPAIDWAKQADIPCLIEPRLAEMHYGAWENKTAAQIEQISPGMLAQWRKDPTGMRPPGGESPEELRQRIGQWWHETREHMVDQHIFVVAHSGSLRMLMACVLDRPISATRHMDMPYAHWQRLFHDGRQTRIISPS